MRKLRFLENTVLAIFLALMFWSSSAFGGTACITLPAGWGPGTSGACSWGSTIGDAPQGFTLSEHGEGVEAVKITLSDFVGDYTCSVSVDAADANDDDEDLVARVTSSCGDIVAGYYSGVMDVKISGNWNFRHSLMFYKPPF